jgi:hypothetical protein
MREPGGGKAASCTDIWALDHNRVQLEKLSPTSGTGQSRQCRTNNIGFLGFADDGVKSLHKDQGIFSVRFQNLLLASPVRPLYSPRVYRGAYLGNAARLIPQ